MCNVKPCKCNPLFSCYRDLSEILSNVAEQVNKSVNEYLTSHGNVVHDDSKQKLLIGQVKELSKNDHAVYKLMCK